MTPNADTGRDICVKCERPIHKGPFGFWFDDQERSAACRADWGMHWTADEASHIASSGTP